MEVLALVPSALREAGFALGVSRWKTVLRVILPTVLGGILTGVVLAVARAAGETAPLLFTSSLYANAVSFDPSQPLPSLPVSRGQWKRGGRRRQQRRDGGGLWSRCWPLC